MQQVSRRKFMRLAAASASLSAIGARASFAQSVPTIKATHFGGPYGILDKIVGKPLADRGIARVVFEVENSGTAFAKMQAQKDNPPFNVTLIGRAVAIRAMNVGLVEPLGPNDIENPGDLIDGAVAPGRIGVSLIFESMDIMYDSKKVSSPITSWLDLWRPEFKGQLLMPALPLPMAHLMIIAVAKSLGGSEKDDKSIEAAFQKLKELKPNIRAFFRDPVQANQLLERGEALAAPQFNIRIGHAMKASPAIVRATPKEGVPTSAYDLVILKGSQNQDVAKKYVNFCVSTPAQQELTNEMLATSVNRHVKIDPANKSFIMSDYARLWFYDEPYVATKQREWFDRWTREIES